VSLFIPAQVQASRLKARPKASSKLAFLIAMIAASVVLVGVFMLDKQSDATFTYLFNEDRGLSAGDQVVHEGKKIGQVTEVTDVDSKRAVSVQIRAAYRPEIYSRSANTARIKKDISSSKVYLEILTRDTGEPVGDEVVSVNEPITGLETWSEEQLWENADKLEGQTAEIFDKSAQRFDNLERWATEGEGNSLKEDVLSFLKDIEDASDSQASKASEKLNELIAKGQEIYTQFDEEHTKDLREDLGQSLQVLKEKSSEISKDTKEYLLEPQAKLPEDEENQN